MLAKIQICRWWSEKKGSGRKSTIDSETRSHEEKNCISIRICIIYQLFSAVKLKINILSPQIYVLFLLRAQFLSRVLYVPFGILVNKDTITEVTFGNSYNLMIINFFNLMLYIQLINLEKSEFVSLL